MLIDENKEKWDREQIEREKKAREELEEWNKMKRFEKIEKLKKKWKQKNADMKTLNINEQKSIETPEK